MNYEKKFYEKGEEKFSDRKIPTLDIVLLRTIFAAENLCFLIPFCLFCPNIMKTAL